MKACPACGSKDIGYPVPDDAVAIRVVGSLSALTLISTSTRCYLDIDDVAHQPALCMDCGARIAGAY